MLKRGIKITLLSALVVLFIASMGGQANAQLQMDLDYEFSGATEPQGPGPSWLTATFDNVDSDTVLLTMDASGLIDDESVKNWLFNFQYSDATNLSFAYQSGAVASITTDDDPNNVLQADGDGYFDIEFMFVDDTFSRDSGASLTSVYEITYSPGITFNSFNYESTPDGGPGVYYSAAQVQDINGENQDSGWIGDGNGGTIVPEPVSSTLFLVGAATLGFRRFRKQKSIR